VYKQVGIGGVMVVWIVVRTWAILKGGTEEGRYKEGMGWGKKSCGAKWF
jgi:hypothetical protein